MIPETSTTIYRLFKYRSISGEVAQNRTRRIIAERQIYYAAPNQFNDPFDCGVCVSMDGADLAKHRIPTARKAEVSAYSENRLRDETNNRIAVLSLAERNNSVLMWSHYSGCHTGICLEFTFEATAPLHRIKYADERPMLYFADFDEDSRDYGRFEKVVIDVLTTKAPDWSYEREWRCIDFGGPGERPMPRNMLTGIVFGCRTSESDKATVRSWATASGEPIAFHQAKEKRGAFSLEIEPLDC
jgi:hypothetical protein